MNATQAPPSLEPPLEQIWQATEALRPNLVALRREFHQHPELSNCEERTAGLVAERLRALGLEEIKTNVAGHGIIALVRGGRPGPVVGYRADMDALPIREANKLPYRSVVPEVMHACGHDAHTAIALGIAEVLSRFREVLPGCVKFLFQPAEENAPSVDAAGAMRMIRAGALENPRPQALFALHVSPELNSGTIGFRAGPAQAAIDVFEVSIRGKAAPGPTPQLGVDTIVAAAECVTALQPIKSRRTDPFEPALLTIGAIHGGELPFNTPTEVKLRGSLRTLSEPTRESMLHSLRETLAGVTSAYGATFELQNNPVTTVLINDPDLVEASLPALRRALGATNVVEVPQRMGGEDFSYYGRVVPAVLFRLGSGNPAKGITAPLHSPIFDIDEDCLAVGVKAMASAITAVLQQPSRE